MEHEPGSLEQVLRQDGDFDRESLLFETMALEPVEVVARDDKNLFQKIGSLFSGVYEGLKDFYAVGSSYTHILTGVYAGMSMYDIFWPGSTTSAIEGLTMIPVYAAIVYFFGSHYHKEFREVRNHLKINGWDEEFIGDRMKNRPALRTLRIIGSKLSDPEYRSILRRATKKAGYLDEFNALVDRRR